MEGRGNEGRVALPQKVEHPQLKFLVAPLQPVAESCTTGAHFIVTSLIFGANKSFVGLQ